MDAYIYQADLLCSACGKLAKVGATRSEDSDDYPQGPYSDGGGESDSPAHCSQCQTFLENSLTDEGMEYVREALARFARGGGGNADVLRTWAEFYGITEKDEDEDDNETA